MYDKLSQSVEISAYMKKIKVECSKVLFSKQIYNHMQGIKNMLIKQNPTLFYVDFEENLDKFRKQQFAQQVFYEFDLYFQQKKFLLRRTYQDFQDLIFQINKNFPRKQLQILPDQNQYIDDMTYQRNKKTLRDLTEKIFTEDQYNQEINFIHIFFEISVFNFEDNSNQIYKQTHLQKQWGTRQNKNILKKVVGMFNNYQERWFVFTKYGVGYIKENIWDKNSFREFVPYSNKLQIQLKYNTKTLKLLFQVRSFEFKIEDETSIIDLLYSIFLSIKESIFDPINKPYVNPNTEVSSFSEQYDNNQVQFFINGFGKNYYHELHKSISKAKQTIFITDWWFSPQLYLLRPPSQYPDSRLDLMLESAAQRGVQVYIIVYREIQGTLYVNSEYVKKWMQSMHKNISVVRHPRYYIHYWSHHEKMCLIDSSVLFMGGLDLCYGRYEEHGYPIIDSKDKSSERWPGIDYANPRIKDIIEVTHFDQPILDKSITPRMPWRDIAVKIVGKAAAGLKKHFIQYWNFYNLQFSQKNAFGQINKAQISELQVVKKHIQDLQNHQVIRRHSVQNPNQNPNQIQPQQIYRRTQFGNELNIQNKNQNLMSTFAQNLKSGFDVVLRNQEKQQNNQQLEGIDDNDQPLPNLQYNDQPLNYQQYYEQNEQITLKIQPLRSASEWSIGLTNVEHSIMDTYIHLIETSQNFIYIENQFFITSTAHHQDQGRIVQNTIGQTIFSRIKTAINNNQNFLVVIVLPLLAGFEGDVTKEDGQLLRIQAYWHLESIRGIINQIKQISNNWQKYLKVFGLRNHDILNGKPVTEIVYVHSKLMIVDDKKVILGSANINDRSMLGSRDSELAVLIQDDYMNQYQGILNGQNFQKSIKISDFRKDIFKSLFGIVHQQDPLYQQLEDPLNQNFWQQIDNQTKFNADFYLKVFGTYPDNQQKTFNDVKDYRNRPIDEQRYYQQRNNVKGIAVPWPYQFLIKEKDMQGYSVGILGNLKAMAMPAIIFTQIIFINFFK